MLVTGCGPQAAAVVNGEKILQSQVDAEIESMKKEHPQVFEGEEGAKMEEQFKQRIVDNLISNILVAQEAAAQGITVTDEDIEKKIASMESQYHSKEQFEEALANSGTSREALKERLRLQLLTARMVEKITADIKITDADAREYYKLNKEVFMSDPKVRVRIIKLQAGQNEQAKKLAAEIEDGASFATVARRESTDPSKSKGGDLGNIPLAELPADIAPAVRTGEVGAILGPIRGAEGVYLVQVVAKEPARQQSYDDVKDRIMQILQQEREVKAFNDWIESLKKKAKIETN